MGNDGHDTAGAGGRATTGPVADDSDATRPIAAANGDDAVREQVRERYAAAARAFAAASVGKGPRSTDAVGCCGEAATTGSTGCGCGAGDHTGGTVRDDPTLAEQGRFGASLYPDTDLVALPASARQASLGCGNPLAVADLHPGQTVLDLGSGGGGDALLSARRVGPGGRVYGLDMTDEMLTLARRHAAQAGVGNVEFRKGTIERIPLPDESVDVVISNCVINLSTDKPAVFREMFRVLRPGGRVGVSDVVAEDHLTPRQRATRGDWVGCVAGALSRTEYLVGLTDAGFTDVSVEFTHQVGDGVHAAVVRAARPHTRG